LTCRFVCVYSELYAEVVYVKTCVVQSCVGIKFSAQVVFMLLARKGENAKSARVSREKALDFFLGAEGFWLGRLVILAHTPEYISFKLQQEAKKTKP
jgi:hypothetical protein